MPSKTAMAQGHSRDGPLPAVPGLDQFVKELQNDELRDALREVQASDPDQSEFLDAVKEVVASLQPLLSDRPELVSVFRQLAEPERQIIFRVSWLDDDNKVRTNRGYRVQFSSALGPCKGGLRFSPLVNLSVVKMLGFEQIFKNALTTLPLGAAKGGSDFNPKGKSDGEVQRFCQAFMSELHRHIGPQVDVPAGDQGVGAHEIGWLFGEYRRLTRRAEGVLTGKGMTFGGSQCRPEATGYGAVYLTQELLKDQGDEKIEGKRCLVSGAGNVALHCASKLVAEGAVVLTLSDSKGTFVQPGGWTQEQLDEVTAIKADRNGSLADYKSDSGKFYGDRATPWQVEGTDRADLAFPCATQNEIEEEDADRLAELGCKVVIEGANKPCTAGAEAALARHGITHIPGKMANAGGVAVSGLEMAQNQAMLTWSAEEVSSRLKGIMAEVYAQAKAAAEEYSCSLGAGANLAAFKRVAASLQAQGAV